MLEIVLVMNDFRIREDLTIGKKIWGGKRYGKKYELIFVNNGWYVL